MSGRLGALRRRETWPLSPWFNSSSVERLPSNSFRNPASICSSMSFAVIWRPSLRIRSGALVADDLRGPSDRVFSLMQGPFLQLGVAAPTESMCTHSPPVSDAGVGQVNRSDELRGTSKAPSRDRLQQSSRRPLAIGLKPNFGCTVRPADHACDDLSADPCLEHSDGGRDCSGGHCRSVRADDRHSVGRRSSAG